MNNTIDSKSQSSPRRWFILAVATTILCAVVVGWWGYIGAVVVVALGLVIVVWLWPETVWVISILSIILGQLVRLPLLGDNAVLINDVILPPLIIAWAIKKLASGNWRQPASSIYLPLVAMGVIMIGSLGMNVSWYDHSELLAGGLYTVRWLEYAALLFIGFEYLRTPKRARRYLALIMGTGVILAILGFAQLKIFPDFSFMAPEGWDPHIGRLLSTWFDPNFLAGYLAALTTIGVAMALGRPWRVARWWWSAVAIMGLALVLTYSRSGYLALVMGVGLVTAVRSRPLFLIGLLVAGAIVLFVPRVQERVIGIRSVDETAQLRIQSWDRALSIIDDYPLYGVGYNMYKYAQLHYGFLDDPTAHSATGSDSSLLTIWVTTGILGLLAYCWLYLTLLIEAWKTWRSKTIAPEWRNFGLGWMAALLALLVHGQFINGLFYPHLMQLIWIGAATAIMVRQPTSS